MKTRVSLVVAICGLVGVLALYSVPKAKAQSSLSLWDDLQDTREYCAVTPGGRLCVDFASVILLQLAAVDGKDTIYIVTEDGGAITIDDSPSLSGEALQNAFSAHLDARIAFQRESRLP